MGKRKTVTDGATNGQAPAGQPWTIEINSEFLDVFRRIADALEKLSFRADIDRRLFFAEFEKPQGPYSREYLKEFLPHTKGLTSRKEINRKFRETPGLSLAPGGKKWMAEGWLACRYRIPPVPKPRQGEITGQNATP